MIRFSKIITITFISLICYYNANAQKKEEVIPIRFNTRSQVLPPGFALEFGGKKSALMIKYDYIENLAIQYRFHPKYTIVTKNKDQIKSKYFGLHASKLDSVDQYHIGPVIGIERIGQFFYFDLSVGYGVWLDNNFIYLSLEDYLPFCLNLLLSNLIIKNHSCL